MVTAGGANSGGGPGAFLRSAAPTRSASRICLFTGGPSPCFGMTSRWRGRKCLAPFCGQWSPERPADAPIIEPVSIDREVEVEEVLGLRGQPGLVAGVGQRAQQLPAGGDFPENRFHPSLGADAQELGRLALDFFRRQDSLR